MLIRLFFSIVCCFVCLIAQAQAKIISKSMTLSEAKGEYTLTLNVVLQGDYTRFIERLMDVEKYPAMEVPNVVEAHKISENPHKRIVWMHMSSFPIQAKYYMLFNYAQGKKSTVVNFDLIPKSGSYEEKHDFEKLSGHMLIKVNSGTAQKGMYSFQSTTRLRFKPGVVDVPEITIDKLIFQAQWGLRVFAN